MTAEGSWVSPLGAVAARLENVSRSSAVRLRELPFLTQLDVRLDPGGPAYDDVGAALGLRLPVEPGMSAAAGDVVVLWLGPDEWLVVAPPGSAATLIGRLGSSTGGRLASVVDVSAHRTTLQLEGDRAREVLASGCALDLHPRVFGDGHCAQTMLARANVVLLVRDVAAPCYWVLVRASFAAYLAEWLIDAATEYVA